MKFSKERAEMLSKKGCVRASLLEWMPDLPICEGDDSTEMLKRGYVFATEYNSKPDTEPHQIIKFDFKL